MIVKASGIIPIAINPAEASMIPKIKKHKQIGMPSDIIIVSIIGTR